MGVTLGISFLLLRWGYGDAIDLPLREKHIFDSRVVSGLFLGTKKPCNCMLIQKAEGTWHEAFRTALIMV